MGPRKAIEQYAVPLWKIPVLLHQVRREMEQEGTVPPLFTELGSVFQASALGSLRRFILSSNSQRNVEQFLRLHKIDGFERIDCGASLFGKGRRLRRLLQVSRLEPSEVAYVGDEQRDVEAAREVGAMSIAVSWGYAERESLVTENPSFIVDRPRELIDVLERVAAGPVACR
jgi:phosphoglycolate phosphatase